MLSRIARNVFVLGQQVERAENIARVLDVNRRMSLEQNYFTELDVWSPILAITHSREGFDTKYDSITQRHVMEYLISDSSHPYSIYACLNHARDMARTIREHISEEMWISINRMYHDISARQDNSQAFLLEVRQFCNAFNGLVNNTMSHNETWHFLRLGIALERAVMTCRILEIKYHLLLPSSEEVGKPLDLHQWQALLRSLSAYEAYRRQYKARIDPAKVLRLLILDRRFPRSLHFSIARIANALKGIGMANETQYDLMMATEYFLDDLRGGPARVDLQSMRLKDFLEFELIRCQRLSELIENGYFNSVTVTMSDEQKNLLTMQIPQQQ